MTNTNPILATLTAVYNAPAALETIAANAYARYILRPLGRRLYRLARHTYDMARALDGTPPNRNLRAARRWWRNETKG